LSLLLVFFEGGEGEELLFPNFRSRRERERKGEKKKLREREREEREEEKKNLWSGILFSSFESDRRGRRLEVVITRSPSLIPAHLSLATSPLSLWARG